MSIAKSYFKPCSRILNLIPFLYFISYQGNRFCSTLKTALYPNQHSVEQIALEMNSLPNKLQDTFTFAARLRNESCQHKFATRKITTTKHFSVGRLAIRYPERPVRRGKPATSLFFGENLHQLCSFESCFSPSD